MIIIDFQFAFLAKPLRTRSYLEGCGHGCGVVSTASTSTYYCDLEQFL